MNRLHSERKQKAKRPWPIPQLVDEAIRKNPSVRGLVKVSPNLSPNLSSAIHPVFGHKNFPALSKSAYRNLDLGLRLATKLLKAPYLLPWWVHVAHGTRVYMGTGDDKEDEYYLEKTKRYSQRDEEMTTDAIDSLSGRVKWTFDIWPGGDFSYARTTMLNNLKPQPLHPLFKASKRKDGCEVFLHDQFRSFAEDGFLDASLEDQLRFSFSFAATIVHELTHCFAAMRRGMLKPEEFFDLKDPQRELGWSWESWAFGGVILACDLKLSPPGHLVWNTWADEASKKHAGGYYRQLVPMDWIAGWFREEIWSGGAQLCVPQCDLVFWEKSRKRVLLVNDSSNVGSKRAFSALWNYEVENEEEDEEEEETLTVQQGKRLCCRPG